MTTARVGTTERPRRVDAARNRARILEAATALFAEKGLEASMPELAERAGVGVGTVYRAFPTKVHLLGALAAERFRWLEGEWDAAADEPDAWAAFERVIWKGAAIHIKERFFGEVIPQAIGLPEVQEARNRALDAMQRVIVRAQEQGAMRADIAAEDVPMLLAGVGFAHAGGPPAALWERHLAVIVDGLRAEGAHPLPQRPLSRSRLDGLLRGLSCPR